MVRKSNGETTDFLKSFHSETSHGQVRWVETHTTPLRGERFRDLCPWGETHPVLSESTFLGLSQPL